MSYKASLSILLASASLFASQAALAADDATEKKDTDAPAKTESAGTSDIWDTREDSHKTYRYIGARYRHTIVPKFVLNFFADGGSTVNVPMGGLEFGQRRDHIEYIISVDYADYSKSGLLFKGKKEPDTSYEIADSELAVIFAKIEILYDIPLDAKNHWSLLVGGGVGLGGVIGTLKRTQAYPNVTGADPNNPEQWSRCKAAGDPASPYCDTTNNHYNYAEPSWASGGSKPFVFPWIALPHVAVRYKPMKYMQARLDLGLALSSGFYFGLGLDYIL